MNRRLCLVFGSALVLLSAAPQRAGIPTTSADHMQMTVRLPAAPGDRERSEEIVAAARRVMALFPTVEAAERAGFKKFLPGISLPMEHYTNRWWAAESWFGKFELDHPTSLLFKRTASGLAPVGVMYTASNSADEAELNRRIPLSLGTWHRHIDDCAPPKGTPIAEQMPPNARFGLEGSITTKSACEAAGGTFHPIVFGWMIHVYPNETDPGKIWAVDMGGGMHAGGDMHMGDGMQLVTYHGLPIPLDELPSLPVTSGDPTRGAIVFANNCQECHGIGGRDGPDAPQLAGESLARGQVAFMIRNPKKIDPKSMMPLLPLGDQEVADVAAFVTGLR